MHPRNRQTLNSTYSRAIRFQECKSKIAAKLEPYMFGKDVNTVVVSSNNAIQPLNILILIYILSCMSSYKYDIESPVAIYCSHFLIIVKNSKRGEYISVYLSVYNSGWNFLVSRRINGHHGTNEAYLL